jgi:hypothetical protein
MKNGITDETKKLAHFYYKLAEVQHMLINDIACIGAYLGVDDQDPELMQALELASSAIEQHFKKFKLQGVKRER